MQEKKTCTICKLEKRIEEFGICGIKEQPKVYYRRMCRKCSNERKRAGKENAWKYQSDETWPTAWKKGNIPWNTGTAKPKPVKDKKIKIRVYMHVGRWSSPARKWRRDIIKRDGMCMQCNSLEMLQAHHIVSWKDNEFLRFELSNGIALCKSCHIKLHQPQRIGQPGTMTGKKHSQESRKRMSESAKGRIPWNKGLKTGPKKNKLN